MFKKNATRVATVGLVAAALVGASASAALAAPVPSGSDGPVYIYDAGNETTFPADHVFGWSDSVVGSASATDARAKFQCPVDAAFAQTFISPVGSENDPNLWSAFAIATFPDATNQILEFPATPTDQVQGAVAAVKATGGNFSVGLACVLDPTHLASAGLWFTTLHVTAGTGAYTAEIPDGPPPAPVGSADINLEATTVAATDGALSLLVPANTTAIIGSPTLVNNLSTSTGALGQFTVTDGRVVTHPGWTLTTTVTDFAKSGDATVTIDKKQLGLAPKFVGTTHPAGVSLSPAQLAGSATYGSPFASADNSAAVGDTVFDADLTFVAPANKPAGTYTSKLTLTLASK